MATCVFCGEGYPSRQRKLYCSDACSKASQKQRDASRSRVNIKSVKVEITPYQYKQHRQIETDADQARIKREIDEKYGCCPSECRSLKGTPEWDEVVNSLTPPERIRKVPALVGLCQGARHNVAMRDYKNEKSI